MRSREAVMVGDGVRDPAGTWHKVTRAEGGWVELDGSLAVRLPPLVDLWEGPGVDQPERVAQGVLAAILGASPVP